MRASLEMCRQSFKDCTQELQGGSPLSSSNLQMRLLQVSLCDAASERVQQILSGDAEPFNFCPKLVELILGYTKA